MGGAGAPPQFQFLGLARQLLTMAKHVKSVRGQTKQYTTVQQMNDDGLATSTTVNNSIMAGLASRRNKLRTCGDDATERKLRARERLRKKLQAKLQAKKH